VLNDLSSKSQNRGIQLKLEAPNTECSVQGDRFLLGQAIDNIISNALDFSHSGQTIDVTLAISGDSIKCIVRDYGTGIPEYAQDRIFERFYSLPRPDGVRSSGLGLNFVREVMQLHGGECSIENHPEGGVEAVLRFTM
jgi:two-component system, OmpR family, sensor histidine kinase CreC